MEEWEEAGMKICLGFPLLARVIEMNHQFLVVSRDRDCQECTEEEGKGNFRGNRGIGVEGVEESLKCITGVANRLRVGLPEAAFRVGILKREA